MTWRSNISKNNNYNDNNDNNDNKKYEFPIENQRSHAYSMGAAIFKFPSQTS